MNKQWGSKTNLEHIMLRTLNGEARKQGHKPTSTVSNLSEYTFDKIFKQNSTEVNRRRKNYVFQLIV